MKLEMKVDLSAITRDLENASKQVRFGIAKGLTRTATDVREAIQKEMNAAFDRPTPWTINSMFVKAAKRDSLFAVVGFKGSEQGASTAGVNPTKTLMAEIEGGARSPKRFDRALQAMGVLPAGWVTVPSRSIPRDGFGNLNGTYLRKLLRAIAATASGPAKPGRGQRSARTIQRQGGVYYVHRVGQGGRLSPGIYLRYVGERSLTPLMIFKSAANYRPRLDVERVALRVVDDKVQANMRAGVAEAMSTAR